MLKAAIRISCIMHALVLAPFSIPSCRGLISVVSALLQREGGPFSLFHPFLLLLQLDDMRRQVRPPEFVGHGCE